ncbi:MAG: VacB/RNase II family 3'-5' exoribonuclease [Pseudomonadales bacterium]
MLNNDTLSQLKQLKQQIQDSKEYAEGIVKATQRKFGFVVLEDSREIYLPPDEMQKVFPQDKVRILVVTENKSQDAKADGRKAKTSKTKGSKSKNSKSKVRGTLEALLESPLNEFNGRYIVKGQGHFVEPDLPRFNRWIFIPASVRKGAKDGDYIRCKISRHPYPQAKPLAKVLTIIGASDKTGIEADYTISKFQLEPEWPTNWKHCLQSVDTEQRQDLTKLSFITIDAPNTQDMDDALYAQTTDTGWQLQIAIADPCALIPVDSALEKLAQQRSTSIYLPGRTVAMLPEELANNLCSLALQQTRPVLVCTMSISSDGKIDDYTMAEALICSQAKLSYDHVANFLDTHHSTPQNLKAGETDKDLTACYDQRENLQALHAASSALRKHREQNHLVINGRQDYHLMLNSQRKLDHIEIQQKNSAHSIVEECMVAANRCAADMLREQGLFIAHAGFRQERIPDVRKLADEQLSLTEIDFATPEGYQQLMKSIDGQTLTFPLRSVLSRLLERSYLSTTASPHQGMGLPAYTTFTSPLRKFSDFMVHRIIKAILNQRPKPDYPQEKLDALQQAQNNARQASSQMEQWLKCQFMKPLQGKTFSGQVSQINSNGFTVRLDEHLIEGFVEIRLLGEKYSFDPMRLRLSSKSQTIELDQAIKVVVKEVDCNQRSIRYTLPAMDKSAPVTKQPDQPTACC